MAKYIDWAVWLRDRINEYRKMHPGDQRSDTELCESLMNHHVKEGLVKKENGKYIVPNIVANS